MRSSGQGYDRERVRQYAERWWDSYNPNYRKFEVDCTNFVSQCLHIGGFPMHGAFQREQGWWYQGNGSPGDRWSLSWAVAHSLHWYLAGDRTSIPVKQVARANELAVGDVICYDWDGNGRWDHTVIVTGYRRDGQPLVNSHTVNSRARPWEYRDSHAWTDRTQYKFFHIHA